MKAAVTVAAQNRNCARSHGHKVKASVTQQIDRDDPISPRDGGIVYVRLKNLGDQR